MAYDAWSLSQLVQVALDVFMIKRLNLQQQLEQGLSRRIKITIENIVRTHVIWAPIDYFHLGAQLLVPTLQYKGIILFYVLHCTYSYVLSIIYLV